MKIGGMAAAWLVPRIARGAVEGCVRRIVILVDPDSANDFAFVPGLIVSGLARHGFADDRDFALVRVPSSGRVEGASLPGWERDPRTLLAARPGVILATGTEFTRILARLAPVMDLVGKRLERLKELRPDLRRVALLMNGAIDGPITRREFFSLVRADQVVR